MWVCLRSFIAVCNRGRFFPLLEHLTRLLVPKKEGSSLHVQDTFRRATERSIAQFPDPLDFEFSSTSSGNKTTGEKMRCLQVALRDVVMIQCSRERRVDLAPFETRSETFRGGVSLEVRT